MAEQQKTETAYMTVGEVAKKMGVTVRTLQYYDREGLLSPSGKRNGRRLYSDRDLILLHQILSLKHLGFSLHDIKDRLISLESPTEVARVLGEQEQAVRKQLASLRETLTQLEALRKEVLQMQTVDFKKYADIIVNLQMKNEYYWLIKHFDDDMLEHIRSRFNKESGLSFMAKFERLQREAVRLQEAGTPPESAAGQAFAAEFWAMVMEFTNGDAAMLQKLMAFQNIEGEDADWTRRQQIANAFVGPALDAWFRASGADPFAKENT